VRTAIAIVALALLNSACSSTTAGDGSSSVPIDATAVALAAAVDVRAAGCRTVEVRGAGSVIVGGHILTAAHVVSGATSITVRSARSDAPAVEAHLIAIDPVHDLALLAADPALLTDRVPLDFAAGGVGVAGDIGEAVLFRDRAAVATPYTIAKPVVVRILDIHHENKVDRPGYEVDIAIAAGDSGAVMVADDGRAVGVLYATSREADSRAFASDTGALDALVAAAADVDLSVGIGTGDCV
jgi:S1-C subfamily serine protease